MDVLANLRMPGHRVDQDRRKIFGVGRSEAHPLHSREAGDRRQEPGKVPVTAIMGLIPFSFLM